MADSQSNCFFSKNCCKMVTLLDPAGVRMWLTLYAASDEVNCKPRIATSHQSNMQNKRGPTQTGALYYRFIITKRCLRILFYKLRMTKQYNFAC